MSDLEQGLQWQAPTDAQTDLYKTGCSSLVRFRCCLEPLPFALYLLI